MKHPVYCCMLGLLQCLMLCLSSVHGLDWKLKLCECERESVCECEHEHVSMNVQQQSV
jgi:hypothetical protein